MGKVSPACGGRCGGVERGTHSNHLDMALLEFALDAVEVSGVEVVAVILVMGDIVVNGALLNRARPVRVVSIMLAVFSHGG